MVAGGAALAKTPPKSSREPETLTPGTPRHEKRVRCCRSSDRNSLGEGKTCRQHLAEPCRQVGICGVAVFMLIFKTSALNFGLNFA